MPAAWNRAPSIYADKLGPVVDKQQAFKSLVTYVLVGVIAAVSSRHGTPLLQRFHVPYAEAIGLVLTVAASLSTIAAAALVSKWQKARKTARAQANLAPSQRQLLGLPPTPAPTLDATRPAAAPRAAQPAAALLSTPLTPAQRRIPVISPSRCAFDTTPRGLLASAASTRDSLTPGRTASPGTRLSPYSAGKVVATPDQLRHYVDAYAKPATATASPIGRDQAAFSSYDQAAYQPYYDPSVDAASPVLPLGRDAPIYRPSLVPRKAAAAGTATGAEALQPSGEAEAVTVLTQLLKVPVQHAAKMPDLVAWTEHFREWLSSKVFKPLVQLLDSCHLEANRLLREAGEQQQLLPSIASVVEGNSNGSSTMGAAAVADAESMVQQLLNRCAALPAHQQEQMRPLIVALYRYDQLLQLLRGRRPANLLPPAPTSYISHRIRSLAKGTCLKAFVWNGGGHYQGREWTPELPNDSGLVLYLFAAFLDAPGGHYPLQSAPEGSRGPPLYLGQLPGRVPSLYSATLAYRPERPGPGAALVIGSNLSGRDPRFTLLVEGQYLTLADRDGVLKVLLMFLRYHAVARQGLIGGYYLSDEALGGLDRVVTPPEPVPTIPQRVFKWWFPAYNV